MTHTFTPGESRALDAILAERERQDAKFGDQSGRSEVEWVSIIGEEFGEYAREANEVHFTDTSFHNGGVGNCAPCQQYREARERLRAELVQVAACALAKLGHLY